MREIRAGIRILRQEPWEALCSFIISQCNNIKRIKGIVERLCAAYGALAELDGERFYTFPDAETLCTLREEDLAMLRCGYRAAYILSAARAVTDGSLNLEALKECGYAETKRELLKLNGVGEKGRQLRGAVWAEPYRGVPDRRVDAPRAASTSRRTLTRPPSASTPGLPSSIFSTTRASTGGRQKLCRSYNDERQIKKRIANRRNLC